LTSTQYIKQYGFISPKYGIVLVGFDFYFTCETYNLTGWEFNGNPLKEKNHTIIVHKAEVNNTGNYTCLGKYPNSTNFVAYAKLYVGCKFVRIQCYSRIY